MTYFGYLNIQLIGYLLGCYVLIFATVKGFLAINCHRGVKDILHGDNFL